MACYKSKTVQLFAGVVGLTKPVPPPKPAKSPQNYQQTPTGPPPYRMPPYPLYNESTPLPGTSNKIHTHSSKFPVSRYTILLFKLHFFFFFLFHLKRTVFFSSFFISFVIMGTRTWCVGIFPRHSLAKVPVRSQTPYVYTAAISRKMYIYVHCAVSLLMIGERLWDMRTMT